MRHRAFDCVHQKQNAGNHFKHAFDFAAEIRVSRGVDNVDFHVVISDGGVFGENGYAPFSFQIAAVHNSFFNLLILAEGAALLQKFVNKSGFAVVDVGDDCNVTQVLSDHCFSVAQSVVR